MDVGTLSQAEVLGGDVHDVTRERERHRQRRLWWRVVLLGALCGWLWYELLFGQQFSWLHWPQIPDWMTAQLPLYGILMIVPLIIVVPMLAMGKSPHIMYRASEIPIGFRDVVGMGSVMDEVVRSLNLFLAYRTFREGMGGNPRRALLFEGPPGTGKTYMAKALAREAGVPFLFVSSSSFQSMYYGQTNRKIRSFFRDLRKAARREGGAIGFIEEIDAIAAARSGMRSTPLDVNAAGNVRTNRSGVSEGVSGVVNELLIQLQSFDKPTPGQRVTGWWIDKANRWLPYNHQIPKPKPTIANVLVVGATNRAADLDPALLRPGRFDRSIHFDLPSRSGRREIIDYYLDRKSHVAALDPEDRREALATITIGYTPVMIEHLFDEGLVWALRAGRTQMNWADIHQAKLTEEVGLKQPVEYTTQERRSIATHEAGHATVAYLVGKTRKLEILSIVKRRDALGLLGHSDAEERFTMTKEEFNSLVHIALGGMVAEQLYFGTTGTGPAGDLAAATGYAARMVGSFGMTGSLVSFEAGGASFMAGNIVDRVLADGRARDKVEDLLDSAKTFVTSLLREHGYLLEALRDALLQRDELIGGEIIEVLEEAGKRHAASVSAMTSVATRS